MQPCIVTFLNLKRVVQNQLVYTYVHVPSILNPWTQMFQNKCTIQQKYYGVAFEFFCLFSQLPAAEKDTIFDAFQKNIQPFLFCHCFK